MRKRLGIVFLELAWTSPWVVRRESIHNHRTVQISLLQNEHCIMRVIVMVREELLFSFNNLDAMGTGEDWFCFQRWRGDSKEFRWVLYLSTIWIVWCNNMKVPDMKQALDMFWMDFLNIWEGAANQRWDRVATYRICPESFLYRTWLDLLLRSESRYAVNVSTSIKSIDCSLDSRAFNTSVLNCVLNLTVAQYLTRASKLQRRTGIWFLIAWFGSYAHGYYERVVTQEWISAWYDWCAVSNSASTRGSLPFQCIAFYKGWGRIGWRIW